MRPTRRGYVVAAVVLLATGSASAFGARGLNAIAAPGVVALAYAMVQVWRIDPPAVERELPRRGAQGEAVTVALDVGVDRPFSARVVDAVGEGLSATGNDLAVTVGGEPITYELELRDRGERTVGPATIEARDVLGLVTRTFETGELSSILVRPPVVPLSGARADELVWLFGGGEERQEFDFLRHYRRGDPLRDIHWPTSAKLPDEALVVKEFSTDEGASSVRLAGESADGFADEMAAATASIGAHLLATGLRVELVTADSPLDARSGTEQRERLLDALARTRGGQLGDDERRRADVLVSAGGTGVSVALANAVAPFSEVAGRSVSVPGRTPLGEPASVESGRLA